MKPIRQTWIDYARGISIILVLYRHVFEGLKNSGLAVADYISLEHANILFFSFRMPLFFIVSGIFVAGSLQKRGLKLFVDNKSRTILYPYFLWGIIQITIQIFLSGYVNSHRTVHDYVYLLYQPRLIEQFWYLYALFNVSVLYAISKSVFKLSAVKNIFIGLIFIYISSYAARNKIDIGFLGDILHYYFFYAIGDLIGRFIRDKNNLTKLYSWKTSALLLIPFIISQVFYLYQNLQHSPKTYDYVENYQPYVFIIIAITGCAFIISICFLLQKANKIKWLHQLGRHSLYIYVAHVIILAATRMVMVKVLNITNVPVLLITGIFTGLIGPVILFKLSEKFNFTILFTLERNHESIKLAEEKSLKPKLNE